MRTDINDLKKGGSNAKVEQVMKELDKLKRL